MLDSTLLSRISNEYQPSTKHAMKPEAENETHQRIDGFTTVFHVREGQVRR
jgi:hypothetical protein